MYAWRYVGRGWWRVALVMDEPLTSGTCDDIVLRREDCSVACVVVEKGDLER